MAEHLLRTHRLEDHRAAFAALSEELAGAGVDLAVELLPMTTAVDLRVDPAEVTTPALVGVLSRTPVGTVGGALPIRPNTWTGLAGPAGDGRACWLGPDEWLLVGDGLPAEEDLRATGASAVDVSAQRTGVRLRGAGARALLAHDCALDLRPASFPPGTCAQTLLGQAGVLLVAHHTDEDGIDVHVRSSFAGYVADLLLDAAEEFRTGMLHTEILGDAA